MPQITLRIRKGQSSPGDLTAEVKENTYDYLLTSTAPTIRVSAYLDRDWPQVSSTFSELFVSEDCAFESIVKRVIPGSRERKDIALPGPMKKGEQLTVEVRREPKSQPL